MTYTKIEVFCADGIGQVCRQEIYGEDLAFHVCDENRLAILDEETVVCIFNDGRWVEVRYAEDDRPQGLKAV